MPFPSRGGAEPVKRATPLLLEYVFLAVVVLVSIAGFWDLYFGPRAAPEGYHHLHLVTNFLWLSLLALQLILIGRRDNAAHRKAGLAVLALAPLLVATTAMMSVHSAQKGVASGRGDPLLVQNVGVTVELAAFILLAFFLRHRRKLHGAMMMATAMLFFGIALFFALLTFVPALKIEGPDTFYRFALAAQAGALICVLTGLAFVIRDWRHGWPLLVAGALFTINDLVKLGLARYGLMQPLTAFVASANQGVAFVVTFVALLALLIVAGVPRSRIARAPAQWQQGAR